MLINLYGFLEGDYLGRLIVVDSDRTVRALADQLLAWGPGLYPVPIPAPSVTNEQGAVLDPTSTLADAGLCAGDIFHVQGARQ